MLITVKDCGASCKVETGADHLAVEKETREQQGLLTKLQNLLKVQLGLKFNLAKDKELESLQAELSSL